MISQTALNFSLLTILGCKAPCSLTCPDNLDIQGYVGLCGNEEYDAALRLIKEDHSSGVYWSHLPASCQTACRRALIDDI